MPPRAAALSVPLVALALLAASPHAHAQTTAYANQAAFLSNVQANYYTETFTYANASNAASYSFLTNGYGYTVTSSAGNVVRTGDEIETNAANRALTFTFTTGNVTALGGNFYNVNAITNAFNASDVTVTVNFADGTTYSPAAFTPASKNAFRGITSDKIISSLVFAAPGANKAASVDNFIVGASNAAGSATPEPSSLALSGASLLPLIGIISRRRR